MSLKCTMKLDWFPDPSKLRCVPSCRIGDMKDGWCDAVNNNAHCRWDEGDCCQSTTSNRRVFRSYLCKPGECSCKDPNAKENNEKPRGDDEDDDEDDDNDDNNSEGSGSDEDRHLRTST